ncbi:MAG: hypothetical protein LUE63_03910 [Lachnospiraceae bacterium]|nr:hypothetical protein [Lachnospiraceae bacterium]
MKHTQDEVIIAQEIKTSSHLFRLEEYWEEDDAGFCCVDYILEKHTRLTVRDADGGRLLKTFDFDSREYDKNMSLSGNVLTVTWCPTCDETVTTQVDVRTLEVLHGN